MAKRLIDKIGFLVEERKLIRRISFLGMLFGCAVILGITAYRLLGTSPALNAAEASVIVAVVGGGGLIYKLYDMARGKDD